MTTKRPETFEQFQRRRALEPLPPSAHNQPADLPSLSHEEYTCVDAAREALATMKRTFEFWTVIARALQMLKDKADRIGGRFTFDRLREREGLGGKRRDGTDVLNKTRVCRLLAILDNLPEVETWRQGITPKKQFEWASPEAVYRHCPVFAKDRPAAAKEKLTPMDKLKLELATALEENHKLTQREDGDRFKPTDTAKDIAGTVVRMFTPNKATEIARQILAMLKGETPKRRSRSAPASLSAAATEAKPDEGAKPKEKPRRKTIDELNSILDEPKK